MAASPEFDVQASAQFHEAMAKLKGPASKTLRLELGKAIRVEAVPVVAELKAAVMAIDSHVEGSSGGASARAGVALRAVAGGHAAVSESGKRREAKIGSQLAAGGFGLRATIARSIGLQLRLGGSSQSVRIRVDVSKLPADQKNLPQALNKAKFRHPTFGHDPWVDQTGSPGWWDRTIDRHREGFRSACLKAMKTTVDKL